MLKHILRRGLKAFLYPFIVLFAPLFYLAARMRVGISLCRKLGFEPLLVHFAEPIPDYEKIPASYFDTPQNLPGIHLDREKIISCVKTLGTYGAECHWPDQADTPGQYYTQNINFGYSSAILLYSMIRHFRCRSVIEIGSGFSTLISLEALSKNFPKNDFKLTFIEPYPRPWLHDVAARYPNTVEMITARAEELEVSRYLSLEAGDLLFIDSSHVAKLGSDVNFLFLQILPRLNPGVIVHIHDIYIPYEYPRAHFTGAVKHYWNEQYLLQALLAENPHFEIILPGFYVQHDLPEIFRASFPDYDQRVYRATSSFWLRRTT
jgi:predicted O-methyltransferase YrrM